MTIDELQKLYALPDEGPWKAIPRGESFLYISRQSGGWEATGGKLVHVVDLATLGEPTLFALFDAPPMQLFLDEEGEPIDGSYCC